MDHSTTQVQQQEQPQQQQAAKAFQSEN